jgi:hypothetical protein
VSWHDEIRQATLSNNLDRTFCRSLAAAVQLASSFSRSDRPYSVTSCQPSTCTPSGCCRLGRNYEPASKNSRRKPNAPNIRLEPLPEAAPERALEYHHQLMSMQRLRL